MTILKLLTSTCSINAMLAYLNRAGNRAGPTMAPPGGSRGFNTICARYLHTHPSLSHWEIC